MIDTTNADTIQQTCRVYQANRVSDYEFRCIRYDAVIDKLMELGMTDGETLLDVGCGRGELKQRLGERNIFVRYEGIDGALNGVDLNKWFPYYQHDWVVAIEVIEHLYDPMRILRDYVDMCSQGVVITTPNPRTVDVLGCDPTHVSVITPPMLAICGYKHKEVSLFKKPGDSLIGWRTK
jgi:2-polyprenyl-3-methyl-5-hydroxy-6-metoxy-1,4-benzoquinol methylase